MNVLYKLESAPLFAALKNSAKTIENANFLHRVHCLILLSKGVSTTSLSQWFGDSKRSMERWVVQYRLRGVNGLRDVKRSGRPAGLCFREMQSLREDLGHSPSLFGYEKPAWDGPLVMRHIAEQFGVSLSLRQCQRLLKRIKPAHFEVIETYLAQCS